MEPSEVLDWEKYLPDWTDDFDFGAFLNLPPDDHAHVAQGGEDGGKIDGPNWISCVGEEQRIDLSGSAHILDLPGPFEGSETHQSSDAFFGTDNVPQAIGHGSSSPDIDAAGGLENLQLDYATPPYISRHDRNTVGDCGDACPIAPAEAPSPPSAYDSMNDLSFQKGCTCMDCLGLLKSRYKYDCRFPNCGTKGYDYDVWRLYRHEKSHYGQPGKYTCLEQDCQVVTKNFGDLRRHGKAKHCTNPNKEQFPCPVPWCKYSGSNGFARKDKLKSHYRNVHEGKPGPVKAGRVIKPATLKPKAS